MDALPPAHLPEQYLPPRIVTLALQGGGSHGAFEWGVLERLLDEPGLRIDAVSGASAGAMNAAMLVQGLATGGPPEAKRLLAEFWRRVSSAGGSLDFDLAPWPWSLPGVFETLRRTSRVPRHLGVVFGLNPLRTILEDLLDPGVFGRPDTPMLVVSATRVRTGEARLFCDSQVGVDALLASACLPQIFSPVEIDGEAYWDGGYSSNPPLRPLIEAGAAPDIILVHTSPLERPEVPRSSDDVAARSAELAFGCALRQELRSLAVGQRLLAEAASLTPSLARLRNARLHMIVAEEAFRAMKTRSKLDPTWRFLCQLQQLGWETADHWLHLNRTALGRRGTVDLARFAGPTLQGRVRAEATNDAALV